MEARKPLLDKGIFRVRGLDIASFQIASVDNAIAGFQSKKKSSGLCHKAAATAACRKLLVVIWGMLRSGSFFER